MVEESNNYKNWKNLEDFIKQKVYKIFQKLYRDNILLRPVFAARDMEGFVVERSEREVKTEDNFFVSMHSRDALLVGSEFLGFCC